MRPVVRALLAAALLTAALLPGLFAEPLMAQAPMSQAPMSWPEFARTPRVDPDEVVRWGEDPVQFGELYLPATPATPAAAGPSGHPVALVIHGGCWLSIADTGYMSRFARFLAEQGWAVWLPEFRRVDMPGGEWPGILVDVARATDHLRELAATYPLDLDRVVAFGHSSGGHLALWLAGRGALTSTDAAALGLDGADGSDAGAPAPVVPHAVVGLAAIAGLEDYHARGGGGCGPNAVPGLLAAEPSAVPDRVRLADPAARLDPARPGSAGPGSARPVLLATGVLDATVPLAHVEAFAADVGGAVRVAPIDGAGHFEIVAPWTDPFASMWRTIESFVGEALANPSGDSR